MGGIDSKYQKYQGEDIIINTVSKLENPWIGKKRQGKIESIKAEVILSIVSINRKTFELEGNDIEILEVSGEGYIVDTMSKLGEHL